MTERAAQNRLKGESDARLRRIIKRLGVDLRTGETEPAGLLFLCLFFLLTFQIATETVRQSTFIDSLGAANLPWVNLLVAVISYPLLRLYNRFVEHLEIDRMLSVSCLVVAGFMLAFWLLMDRSWTWVTVAFYLFTSIVYGLLVSQFWLFANHLFDPRQARRLFGFIGAGALLGGILGGQIARLAGKAFGTGAVPLVAVVLLLAVTGILRRAKGLVRLEEHEERDRQDRVERARGGFQVLRHSRPLQTIAAVLVLTVVVSQIVDLQFNWAVEHSTTTLDQRTAFYGNFFSVMGIAAFVFQLVFAGRILRSLGIGFALRMLPVTVAVGTVGLFLAVAMLPEMLIGAALILKIGESGLRYSLDQSTRELLFAPVPSKLRLKAKAFIDVVIQRGAKGLAALLLLPVTFGLMTAVQAGWMTLFLIVVWLVVLVAASRAYIRAFKAGLVRRTVDPTVPIDLSDITTLELLLESLGSSDSRQVLNSLDLLVANGRRDLVPPLLLYHDDAEVRRRTLVILAEEGRVDVVPLIERRLGDGDPDVRAEAIRVLAGMQGQDVCETMLPKLEDADPGIRAAAVACLANHGDQGMLGESVPVLVNLLSDGDPKVRIEAAKAIGAVHEPLFQEHLIRLLYDADPRVIREAIAAVRRRVARDGFNPLYVPTLVSLLQNRRAKHEAREALVAFGEPAIPTLVHFMNDADEPIWVRRALPKAIARIGTLAASRALLDSLEQREDSFFRRNLVESLGSIRGAATVWSEASEQIRRQVFKEAESYLVCLATLKGLGLSDKGSLVGGVIRWDGDEVPTLLDQLFEERAAGSLRNMFGLLALLYGGEQVWPAFLSLISEKQVLRARALEFLDNTLQAEVKKDVFAVIDDCPLAEKLEKATIRYGVPVRDKAAILDELLSPDGQPESDCAALAAAALYAVHQERVPDLEQGILRLAAGAEDPFVKETAVWIKDRLGL